MFTHIQRAKMMAQVCICGYHSYTQALNIQRYNNFANEMSATSPILSRQSVCIQTSQTLTEFPSKRSSPWSQIWFLCSYCLQLCGSTIQNHPGKVRIKFTQKLPKVIRIMKMISIQTFNIDAFDTLSLRWV